jgi:hypothetical protein
MGYISPKKMTFKAFSPFSKFLNPADTRTPLIWDRIDRRIRAGRPNVILIEGGGQCGKSTLAQYICEHYDEHYVTVFSVKELMDIMEKRVEMFKSGDRSMLWKWIWFEEIQSEALRQQWSNQRNIVIGQIVGLWGELKQNLVLTCPNIDDVSPRLYGNVAVRMLVDAEWKKDHIERTAFLFKPVKDLQKKGYKWGGAGRFTIPEITRAEPYLATKMENMSDKFVRYRADLDRQNRKHYGQSDENYIPTPLTEERKKEHEEFMKNQAERAKSGL